MLQELDIRNYALIERVKIAFSEGLNILTGETGAGKSIIIGALGLVLGERSSPDVIRTGADNVSVIATIDVSKSPSVGDLLSETNFQDEDGNTLILSREISKSGRNKYSINYQPSTLQLIRQIGDNLIDIHGQHEHQTLFRPEKHIEILDDFGGLKDLAKQNLDIYNDLKNLMAERDFLIKDRDEKLQQKELFEFQLNELKNARLEDGEEERLSRERQLLNNAELIFELSDRIYRTLYDSDDPNVSSVVDMLKSMRSDFAKLCQIDRQIDDLFSRFESTIYELEDIASQIIDYRDRIDFDPIKITEVESRLDLIYKLKRKYGVDSIKGLIEYRNEVAKKLEDISLSSTRIDDVEKEIKRKTEQITKVALELSRRRQENAKKLKVLIEKELRTLGMEKTVFDIRVTQNEVQSETDVNGLIDISYNEKRVKLSPNGVDTIEFLISPNPGEELRPLTKIASGGEISRIMLAIKTVLAVGTSHSSPVILIFDEIDTGISGRIAEIVGKKLKELSKSRQVICITHLPQIASLADTHYRVQKKVVGERTFVEVERLDPDERVNEIARMLAGERITEVTLAHAQEMIQQAKEENKF